MKLYANLSHISNDTMHDILGYFFNICNKVNIYFPNDSDDELISFKDTFLEATSISELNEDESSPLEPKEGFSMVIASLSPKVNDLLTQVKSSYHLSFGLIQDDKVLLYLGDEGEVVIESDDESITSHSLFLDFKAI